MTKSLSQMSLWEGSLAKTSRSPAWGPAQDYEAGNQAFSTNLRTLLRRAFPALFSSKTSRDFSLPTKDEISQSSFGRWPTSGMAWDGECLTAVTSEFPSRVSESTLSAVVETGEAPQRYFLSPNAAMGMLRRANQMGRPLFLPLRRSLEILSQGLSIKG
jgi:hypothetical protein